MNSFFSSDWIWLDPEKFPDCQNLPVSAFDRGESATQSGKAIFRKSFEIESLQKPLKLRFSGDCKFTLWLNGSLYADGPCEVGGDYANTEAPDWWFYEERDITDDLRDGSNLFVAEVQLNGDAQTDYSTGHGGFFLQLIQDGEIILRSDASWKASYSKAWSKNLYRAWLEPWDDWLFSAFDDSTWPNAVVLSPEIAKRWHLMDSGVPPLQIRLALPESVELAAPELCGYVENPAAMINNEQEFTVIKPGPPVTFYLKFKEELAACLSFELNGSRGAYIDVSYEEIRGVSHHSERYELKNGWQIFRTTRMNAFQYVKFTVSCGSFDSNSFDPVEIRLVNACSRAFPLNDELSFICSNADYNRLWSSCMHTLKLCMQRLHLDSPVHQEGGGCTGDSMIEALTEYYLFGETRLAAADLRRTAYLLRQKDYCLFHSSYTLLFIEMLRDYYMYSGDSELLRELYPDIQKILTRFNGYRGELGLLSEAPNYMFIDWVNSDGYQLHHPNASRGTGCLSAWFFQALKTAAFLAGELNDSAYANECRVRADEIFDIFNFYLWDKKTGLYKDGIPHLSKSKLHEFLPPDDGMTSYSMHCNILALAYGLAPLSIRESLLSRLMSGIDKLPEVQPYFMHYVFEALYKNKLFDLYGFKLLERWMPMLKEHPDGLKECWNCGDYSHAWSGTPAYQFGRSVLGVKPLLPGFKKVQIKPVPGPLSFAMGAVLTPLGKINITWQTEYDTLCLTVDLPEEMDYEIVPPRGPLFRLVKVVLNGKELLL